MRLGRKVIASAVPPNLTENLSARLDLAVRSPGAFVFPRCRLTPAAGSLCCVLQEKYSFRVVHRYRLAAHTAEGGQKNREISRREVI